MLIRRPPLVLLQAPVCRPTYGTSRADPEFASNIGDRGLSEDRYKSLERLPEFTPNPCMRNQQKLSEREQKCPDLCCEHCRAGTAVRSEIR
jgi:hypothetical protein